jgi:glycosyltransferase involved in cell wall biosynthesis
MTRPGSETVCLISVIIAHLNQPEYLRMCLTSLQQQSFDMTGVEIIVVDNGSRVLPHEVVAPFKNVHLETEAQAGPGPARNKGVAVARGKVLAFIDSDCIADSNWLATVWRVMQPDSGFDIVGGNVKVATAMPGRPTMVEAYEQVFSFRQQFYVEQQGFSATLNMATRPDVFKRVGAFGGIEIAEDRDWGVRAGKLGIKTHFVPDMWVTHPARRNMQDLCGKLDRILSHDHEERAHGIVGQVRWFAKALAVAVSPVISMGMVMRSNQVRSSRDRWLAGCGLVLVRLYRARKMLSLQFGKHKGRDGHSWNRG